ncbi:hypothetical protein LTR62_008067 [Meristemomyces frigidus]|uniref:Phosphotyrosine protein phosphatase I domain-containing protein n=1 Tax=Meristemomyces frigidus TaxID=1508187 RepID=A0AAN7YHF6_9PEZI|nr:hypothetical protein LTR62_008067 [Meristemomyces frigidus]
MTPAGDTIATRPKPVSVLFVCLGNICRYTMAEATLSHLLTQTPPAQPLISKIDSCGTGAYHEGAGPDPRTMAVLKDHGITGYQHRARKITVRDFGEYDYILAMDRENLADLQDLIRREGKRGHLTGREGEKVRLFGSFAAAAADAAAGEAGLGEEVEDPYYGGEEGFELAYQQVVRLGRGLVREIEKEEGRT